MKSDHVIAFRTGANSLATIESAPIFPQGVRDQNGVVAAIVFSGGINYTLEVQGAAEFDGASTIWHALQGSSSLGSSTFPERKIGGFSFTAEFPLMPVMRVVVTQDVGIGSQGFDRVEAWLIQ